MKSIGRATALVAVLGMPVIAYVMARVAASVWEGMDSVSLADASVALEDGLALAAATVGAAIASYLALTGYAMLLGAAWHGGRAIPKALTSLAPHGWTRVTATALGLTMSAGLAAPALAAEAGSTHAPSAGWVAAPITVTADASALDVAGWVEAPASDVVAAEVPAPASLTVGWVEADAPNAPASASPSEPQLTSTLHDVPALETSTFTTAGVDNAESQAPTPPSSAYVVQPGDSLWRITEAHLGADSSGADSSGAEASGAEASRARVAAAWPELYEANRNAIGGDPALIQPGLALTIPAGFGA